MYVDKDELRMLEPATPDTADPPIPERFWTDDAEDERDTEREDETDESDFEGSGATRKKDKERVG